MSKKLEMWEKIKNREVFLYMGYDDDFEDITQIIMLEDIITPDEIEIIEKALTPPTEEEVCKALSKVIGCHVEVDEQNNHQIKFIAVPESEYPNKYYYAFDLVWQDENAIMFNEDYKLQTPYLLMLLGRFYDNKNID